MATAELKSSLEKFVTFARGLKGDEKSEAQTFLDHFFRALGHSGVIEAGATFEFRVAKKPGSAQLELLKGADAVKAKGGKKFADLLWPERVLIEMKSRGEKLEKHYDQAFDYWTHIVPKRPPYVILCNFDEFWIYDFNTQLFDPVEKVFLRELSTSAAALGFLLPKAQKPIFGNNRVEVTRKAADTFAEVFRKIITRGEDRTRAQRFILQLLVSVVAEDLSLLPGEIVTTLLAECVEKPGDSYDLLGGLFQQMARAEPARGGRYTGVDYFNGGLFAVVDPIELKHGEAYSLHHAALTHDWAQVKPEIFGTLFQHSMDAEERHAFGAHFTSEFDIQKVVGPTIVRPWRERIDAAGKDPARLIAALDDLRRFRVLDPACGSGNFLFVAYREMKRLERDLLVRLQRAKAKIELASAVSIQQFHGLDTQPFAVELAKVTLMLAKELEIREAARLGESEGLFFQEKPLPLDNLDANIRCADALFTEWPAADAIIGNPPYLGAKLLKPEYGEDYVKKMRTAYPEIPGMADLCVYWFRRAHDALGPGQRAGLVGTQNIRNNNSRAGGLDYIVSNGGTITEAVSAQVWSGEAAVHVSIVNWIKGEQVGEKFLHVQRGDSVNSLWETFELPTINPSLSTGVDVGNAEELHGNQEPPVVYNGQFPRHHGFVITPEEAAQLIAADPRNCEVVHPFLIGAEMLTDGSPQRWVIDFQKRDLFEARSYAAPFDHLRAHVLPRVTELAEKEKEKSGKSTGQDQQWLKTWWQFFRCRKELIDHITALPRYMVCCEVTKRPIFCFIDPDIRPDHTLEAFVFADDYSFGVIQSDVHWHWFKAKCSKLKGDFRYTPHSVFETFPWPQTPMKGQTVEVAAAAVALRGLRRDIMDKLGYSLRELYRTLEEPGTNPLRDAHTRLDTAVRAAYGMAPDADPLAFLLALNLKLASKEKAGEKITPPGLPLPEPEHAAFITDDCVRVAE
ncbi:MAG: N-6 DNA methylase [Chthoniobacter sp.]|nr:N-6 DNA methylase [Chthoniobacter sp.]